MKPTLFLDSEHEAFYYRMLDECRNVDGYHRALFYTLGISKDTRGNIHDVFDFSNGGIKPEGLSAPWQTGSSVRTCRLAFNLWNGWSQAGAERYSTPHELFDCGFAPYFVEAIRLRYPEYCKVQIPPVKFKAERSR
ncbi:hypothetical protein B1748_16510 [Paenibacillus sp. MY03]|jgi:hypothetical protein|uniref:DUF6075 family protein n=1 Tax=Paenibacillaceae TaxID=186822 RepID=UPI000B3CA7B7|nr:MULTISPECIES: DUF6075 family protein [Paenibacillaceae]OUS75701.1 hypothetical protein B1748_16510 [Paenibacillus sp. MY03]QTH40854.1 hypothetical protein J4772_25295 [Cohnella sp. LGH]